MNQVSPADGASALSELDHYLLTQGRHYHLHRVLGAHLAQRGGATGVRFAVWAPNARRVSVVGDFNAWDGSRHPMSKSQTSGIFELFIPGLTNGAIYKY